MRIRSALLLGLVAQFAVIAAALAYPFTQLTRLIPDDAFYYFQIARMLAGGEGSVFSPGEPTNGYHPLWQGLLWALASTGPTRLTLVALALALCVLCNTGAAWLLARWLRHVGATPTQQAIGALLYLASPWPLLMTLSGLETALWGLTILNWLWAVSAFVHLPNGRRAALLGTAAALLFLARTDSVFLLVPAAIWLAWLAARRRLPWLPLIGAGVLAAVFVAPWLLWNYATFGSIVQQSGTAMTGLTASTLPPPTSLDYWLLGALNLGNHLYRVLLRPLVWQDTALTALPLTAALALCVGAALLWACWRSPAVPRWLTLGVAAHLAFEALIKLFTQHWHSFDLVLIAVLALAALPPLRTLARPRLAAVTLALMLLAGYSAATGYCAAQAATDTLGVALRLGAESPRRLLVGATDAGYLAYWSRHEVVNLDGIVNARAYDAIAAGRWSAYVASRPFDLVLVDPARRRYYDRALAAGGE